MKLNEVIIIVKRLYGEYIKKYFHPDFVKSINNLDNLSTKISRKSLTFNGQGILINKQNTNELKKTRTRQNTVAGLKQYRIEFLNVPLHSVTMCFL